MPAETPGSGPEQGGDLVDLIQIDGTERRFRLHDAFDVEGADYYLVEAEDDPEMVLLLKESNGALETVEPDEFDRVMAILEDETDE